MAMPKGTTNRRNLIGNIGSPLHSWKRNGGAVTIAKRVQLCAEYDDRLLQPHTAIASTVSTLRIVERHRDEFAAQYPAPRQIADAAGLPPWLKFERRRCVIVPSLGFSRIMPRPSNSLHSNSRMGRPSCGLVRMAALKPRF